MLHHFLILATEHSVTNSGFGVNFGTLLVGVSELLLAIGAGIGFLIRYRKAAKKATKAARNQAVKDTQRAAERLTEQYDGRIHQYEATVLRLQTALTEQQHMYEERLENLQALNNTLLAQILNIYGHGHDRED